ncbi:LysR family transcriptional regulator [Vibrio lamellibrachiae]|uniref:LysR family transcriptional regulator n=1 Tax=Vibrio lamellibrachiae TaxID=2910253 RepID=UPI003D13E1BD
MKNKIDTLDLNLMKLLKAVVETQNTHLAAERLGISQTSVSRGLAKLREVFGDQLFIRKAHGVEPSELAEKLAQAADEMMTPIIKVVESYQDFDPLVFNGSITIAVNTFLQEIFGSGLINVLKSSLPNAKFKIIYWQSHSLGEMLSGEIDYMIQLAGYPIPQEVYTHTLCQVQNSIVARVDHPILSKTSAWDEIHHLPIARLFLDGINSKRSVIEELYLQKGYVADVELTSHSLATVLEYIATSDSLLYSSSYISNMSDKLTCYPLPPLSQEYRQLDICGGYLQTRRGYPLNQFLHQVFQSHFDTVIQPS